MKTKVYVLPGIMCDERLWSKIKKELEPQVHLVHTPIPLKNSLDEMTAVLNTLFEEEKVYLLGFSLGGYIASYFSVQYPHRIKKLFVVGNSGCDLPKFEIQKRKETINLIQRYGFKGLSRRKVIGLLEENNHNDEVLIALIQDMYKSLGKDAFKYQLGGTLNRRDLLDELCLQTFPMTFMYSLEDRLVNIAWLEKLKKKHQKVLFLEYKGRSHMLPLEKPHKVSSAIMNWLNL